MTVNKMRLFIIVFVTAISFGTAARTEDETLRFIDAPLSAVLATFSSITGLSYSDELRSTKTITFVTKDKIKSKDAHQLLDSLIKPLGGKLEKVSSNSFRVIPIEALAVNSSKLKKSVLSDYSQDIQSIKKAQKNKDNSQLAKSVVRLDLQNKIDRRGLEQLAALDPTLKSMGIVNDGLSENSVIVVGTTAQLSYVRRLLNGLSGSSKAKQNIEYNLANEKTANITPKIKEEEETNSIASEVIDMRFSIAETVVASLENVLEQAELDGQGRLSAHKESNQIVLVGSDQWLNVIRPIILKMDREPRQIYVDAIIAEISENSTRQLGLQFSGRSGVVGAAQVSASGGLSQGTVVGNTMLTGLTGGMLAIGGGASAIPDLGVLLTALEGDTDNRILATPSLMTLENRESEILVGQNVPFITGKYSSQSSDQSAAPFQTIQREDLGISLKVLPRIGSNNDLIIEIKQEVSGLDGTTTGLSDVATKKREIATVVRARPGETIAIGGLRDTQTERTTTKVPFLGDLPGVGLFFRQEAVRTINTNLIIFLRPTLMTTEKSRVKMFDLKQNELVTKQRDTQPKLENGAKQIEQTIFKFLQPENSIHSFEIEKKSGNHP